MSSEINISDEEAMDAIHGILDGTEWGSDTFEEIKNIVEQTGRHIEDCFEHEE